MKTKFIFALALFAAGPGCQPSPVPAPGDILSLRAGNQDGSDGQRLVSLLDYVAADYGGAVSGGAVVSAFEYEEQLGFLETATTLVPQAARNPEDREVIGRLHTLFDYVFDHAAKPAGHV